MQWFRFVSATKDPVLNNSGAKWRKKQSEERRGQEAAEETAKQPDQHQGKTKQGRQQTRKETAEEAAQFSIEIFKKNLVH